MTMNDDQIRAELMASEVLLNELREELRESYRFKITTLWSNPLTDEAEIEKELALYEKSRMLFDIEQRMDAYVDGIKATGPGLPPVTGIDIGIRPGDDRVTFDVRVVPEDAQLDELGGDAAQFATVFSELSTEDIRELFWEFMTAFLREVLGAAGMDVDEATEDRFAERIEVYADRFEERFAKHMQAYAERLEALLVERAERAAYIAAATDADLDERAGDAA